MINFDRRSFLQASAGALSAVPFSGLAFAAPACITSGLPKFQPKRLTVDCATKTNFAIFRKNPDYMGLAGAVSMTYVRGKYGEYPAGNLFLFPWLKKKGQALGAAKDWQTRMPTGLSTVMAAAPIPNWNLPLDEFFVRYRLQGQPQAFIGFRVDVPLGLQDSRRPWFTNVPKLTDGKGVGIAWTSSNLNHQWFGGSRFIPVADQDCQGKLWRALIVDGINQASNPRC